MLIFAFKLSNIWTILLFVVIICFLIAWHELGHLLTAKKCNVFCYEYSIGFGPILYRNRKHETHFCIRAIPLGGFVKMAGEEGLEEGQQLLDNNSNPIPENRILAKQSAGKRALILAAGGIMNVIFALVCFYFFISFNRPYGEDIKTTGFVQTYHNNSVYIEENSLLEESGMESGDIIINIDTYSSTNSKVESYRIKNFNNIITAIDKYAPKNDGDIQYIKITYQDISDNKEVKNIDVSRHAYLEDGKLNISYLGLGQNRKVYEYNALTALYGVYHFTAYYTGEILYSLGRLFTGDFSSLSGLVGIYSTVDAVATDSSVAFSTTILRILYLAGAISFSLGFFNLIPFPALDGGRLVFVAIEAIFKKKVNPNTEATIHFVGLILLFALMIIINIRDIFNLF